MQHRLWHRIGTLEAYFFSPRRGFSVWALRLSLVVLTSLVTFQQLGGSLLAQDVALDPATFETYTDTSTKCFTARFSHASGDGPYRLRYSTLQLFEDGQPIGPSHSSHHEIEARGEGRYSHWGHALFLSSSDGSDPRTNGKSYSVRYERRLTPVAAILLLALTILVWARPLRLLLLELEDRPLLVLFLLCAATLSLRLLWGFDTGYVDYVRVKQMPFSDAHLWLELSEDFSQGIRTSAGWTQWGARRPMTYVINGSWLALVGASSLAICLFNGLCSGLSAALIFDALRRIAPFPIALTCALLHAGSLLDAAYGTTMLSEPSGYFLSNVAVWLLVRAIVGERRGEAPTGLYFVAGIVIAIANMSRPLTLLSVAGVPLVVVLVLSRRGLTKLRVFQGSLRAGVFVFIGVAICLVPWIVRQRAVHGITTLSDNTAEMLFAASAPEFDGWSPEASLEATNRGHRTWASRNAYFNARFKENLQNHPAYYAKVIAKGMTSSLLQMATVRWWIVGLLLLALWSSGSRRVRGEFLLYAGAALAIALALAYELPPPRVWAFFGLGALLALLQAHLTSVLVVSLGLTLFSIGLVAAPYPRFTYSLHWLALAIEIWAVWELGRLARQRGRTPDQETRRAAGELPPLAREGQVTRLLSRVLLGFFALLGLGLLIALSRKLDPSPHPPIPAVSEPAAWLSAALDAPEASDYAEVTSGLVVRRFYVRKNFLASFDADEPVSHRSGLFQTRSYARTYFHTTPPPNVPSGLPVIGSHAAFPGRLDPERDQLVTAVGYWVAYGPEVWTDCRATLFEVLAFTRAEQVEGAPWTWGEPLDRRRHAGALLERAQAGDVFTDSRE